MQTIKRQGFFTRVLSGLLLCAGLVLSQASSAHAQTNCNGSSGCGGREGNVASDLANFIIANVNPNQQFVDTQQIACKSVKRGFICAFLQRTGTGATGQEIKNAVQNIPNHKCRVCGSTTVKAGELTFNFTTHGCKAQDGLFTCS